MVKVIMEWKTALALFGIITIIITIWMGRPKKVTGEMFPFNNPFRKKFFEQPDLTFDGFSSEQFMNNLLSGNLATADGNHTNLVQAVNQGEREFAVVNEDMLYELQQESKNIRFVASIYPAYLNLLAPNDVAIKDLNDIKEYVSLRKPQGDLCVVNVGKQNGDHHLAMLKVVKYLDLEALIEFDFTQDESLVQQRYSEFEFDLVARVSAHPNKLIKQLSNKVQSHLVSMYNINNGDIHQIRLNEQRFYHMYPNYRKVMHDLEILVPRIYPQLTQLGRNQLYIPTIASNYILISNEKVADAKIKAIVSQLVSYTERPLEHRKPMLRDLDKLKLSYSKLNMPVHPVAHQLFKNMNLHTTKDNAHCIYYKPGYCPAPDSETRAILMPKDKLSDNVNQLERQISRFVNQHAQEIKA